VTEIVHNGLRVRGLTKSFGSVDVINGIDLDIAMDRRHLIIGPNGAGKTTFFNLLTGQIAPSGGDIEFLGRPITHMPVHLRARIGLGRTYQIASLFRELTVWENLLLAANAPGVTGRTSVPAAERAVQALGQCGLEAKRSVAVRGLSYGEQRRLEIALSLAMAPKMLLLDEPMAGLTQDERRTLAERIVALSRTVGIALIEHDLEIATTIAERLTVFHLGRVVADGDTDTVLAQSLVREIYLG
jgi:branched-chain amino acid transport system ATP-binding protein